MKVIFAGTPEVAVPVLDALIASEHEVLAVITRPDAPHGRGRSLRPSPVATRALEAGIEVLRPTSLKADTVAGQELRERIADLAPDCFPVVAYGGLIPADLLEVAPHCWINLHFSLLPSWRGAAPVQAAIASGDEETGVSIFQIEAGLDTGPVFAQQRVPLTAPPLASLPTSGELLEQLADLGSGLFVDVLNQLDAGTLSANPQVGEATHAAKITVESARIDWTQPAAVVERNIRAVTPAPGAWTTDDKEARIKLGKVVAANSTLLNPQQQAEAEDAAANLAPGQVLATKKNVWVGTGDAPVLLSQIQVPGKKMMNAADWARGNQSQLADLRWQ